MRDKFKFLNMDTKQTYNVIIHAGVNKWEKGWMNIQMNEYFDIRIS